MIDLENPFGPRKRSPATWAPVIVIRHGFNSKHTPFRPLAAWLKHQIPNATINNIRYAWRDSVLVNGARLASYLIANHGSGAEFVLVGHSMGGLVLRVANCFLRDGNFAAIVPGLALSLGYAAGEVQEIRNYAFGPHSLRNVVSMAMLATPNSGALLHGQVSGLAALVQSVVNVFPPTQVSSVADLTTDRLHHILKNASVDTPVLTISGSQFNRFAIASGQIGSWLGLAGISLEMPHDVIVEDRSVNLTESILPNEIAQKGTGTYRHLRAYESCADVRHTNIYDDPGVRDHLLDFLLR